MDAAIRDAVADPAAEGTELLTGIELLAERSTRCSRACFRTGDTLPNARDRTPLSGPSVMRVGVGWSATGRGADAG